LPRRPGCRSDCEQNHIYWFANSSTEFGMMIDSRESRNSSESGDKITETHNLQPLTVL
jgi:hypothetical protein